MSASIGSTPLPRSTRRCCGDPGDLAEQLVTESSRFDVRYGGRDVKAVHHQLQGAGREVGLKMHATRSGVG